MLGTLASRDMPSGPVFGLFCAIAAIAMAAQTYSSYRKGFMYCGPIQVVYRKDNPKGFRFWLVIQLGFVLILGAFSVYGFLT